MKHLSETNQDKTSSNPHDTGQGLDVEKMMLQAQEEATRRLALKEAEVPPEEWERAEKIKPGPFRSHSRSLEYMPTDPAKYRFQAHAQAISKNPEVMLNQDMVEVPPPTIGAGFELQAPVVEAVEAAR